MKIKVCDALCGAGKTRSCINMMNNSTGKRYLFVTPYLDEVERIKNECKSRDFTSPQYTSSSNYSKREDIIQLFQEGKNIATTHSLFSRFDESIKTLIKEMKYTMILDEVIDLFQPSNFSSSELELLKRGGVLRQDGDDVYWTDDAYDGELFREVAEVAKSKNLKQYSKDFYFWCLPADLFSCFDEVYILTYMYKYQMLAYFLSANNIDYELIGTKKENGVYQFCSAEESSRCVELRDKIHIIENEKYNAIGNHPYSLSAGWFERSAKQKGKENFEKLKKNIYNALRPAKSNNDKMWTSLKQYYNAIKGKGYASAFLSFNMRASNDYADRHYLAYCLNVFTFPWMKNYLDKIGGENVSQDMFALSTLIQWIFRSAIRKGEEIWIYVPSKRMRYLLTAWLDNLSDGKDLEEIKFLNEENISTRESVYAVASRMNDKIKIKRNNKNEK